MWKLKKTAKTVKLNKPILIEGLPGIANVGKIAIDFLVEVKKAKKIYELHSDSLPHSVFVKEDNLVELPKLEIYHHKAGKQDFLFLTGAFQPTNEQACYELCKAILEFLEKNGCKEIITTGGIGLPKVPKKPKVFCTANSKRIVTRYKKKSKQINDKAHGVIDSVVGVTGLLLGLAEQYKIESISLLAETLAHPFYMGISGAREILKVLDENHNIGIDLEELDKEIKDIESQIMSMSKTSQKKEAVSEREGMSYIG